MLLNASCVPSKSSSLCLRSFNLLVVVAGLMLPATTQAQTFVPNWVQESTATGPSARYGATMAYDPTHGQVVLFGGDTASNTALGDTWLWNGTTWTQQNPVTSPPARFAAAMAFDAASGQMVLFGGAYDAYPGWLNDTWVWDGANWTQQSPGASPSARGYSAMTYDAASGQVVLFGGANNGPNTGDTWVWNGTTWTQESPATSPSARDSAAMAYDTASGQVVLFGGYNSGYLDDTWVWNGTTWAQESPATSPSARWGAAMAYDSAPGQVILFGGGNGAFPDDTWLWNGTTWTAESPATGPSGREFSAMAYDSASGQIVLFGGYNGGFLNDTWVWGQGDFGSQAIGSTSAAQTLNFSIPASTTVGSIGILTQGAANLDFTDAGGSTCTATTYPSDTNCVVNVQFKPAVAGLRQGAVVFFSGAGNTGTVLSSTPVYGIGTGPEIAFGPGVQTTVPASGLVNPYCVALDAADDVFIADTTNKRVVKVPAGGGPQTTVGSGLSGPFGLAVDGAGDVFIADIVLNEVVEVPAGGGPQTTVGTGLSTPYGVAVDAAGDVFIADSGNNRVVEVPAGGGSQFTVGSGFYSPVGVAVDGAGDVFVADRLSGNNRVVEVPAGGGPQITVVGGLNNPGGLAVDAAGDLFVADFDNNRVLEVPADGSPQTTLGTGIDYPFGVAVDGAGNAFIVDWGNSRVVEVQRAQPPSLSFATTNVGSTSNDSPQVVEAINIGNQPLTFTGLSYPIDFPYAGSGANPCISSTSLSAGQECDLDIDFSPLSAGSPLSENVTLTDNALNIPGVQQLVAVSGTAQLSATTTATVFDAATGLQWSGSETAGASAYGTATVTPASSGPAPTGSATYTFYAGFNCVSAIATSTETLSAGSVPNSGLFGPLAAGTYSLQASYSGDGTYNGSSSTCQNFSVGLATTTTSVASSLNPSAFGQSVTLTAIISGYMPSGTVGFTSNGTPIAGCSGATVSSSQAQCTTSSLLSGNDAIVATYSGDANNNASWGSLSSGQQVTPAILVVNQITDDAGTASNCNVQTTPGTTTNVDTCSLRDALLFSANAGAASISFDSTVFLSTNSTAQNTINLTNGTLNIPSNTSISGPTSGSGYTLTNLVTVAGGGSSNQFSVFTVNSGVTAAGISGLTIANGYAQYGGAIYNWGALTISNTTFLSNSASDQGGAIYGRSGTLTVVGSTFSTNNSGAGGGAIFESLGSMSVDYCTFSGNVAGALGGAIRAGSAALAVSNSTFSGNSSANDGGAIYAVTALTVSNTIFSGNSSQIMGAGIFGPANSSFNLFYNNLDRGATESDCDGCTTNTQEITTNPNLAPLGNYGGPTQTLVPLPGSGAICAASSALIPAGFTTDQRGLANSTTYGSATCYDVGAVQTNYALSFTTNPPASAAIGQAISPAPVVSLTESNVAATVPTSTVTMTDSNNVLSGNTAVSLASGSATFSSLVINTTTLGDQLTASLSLNPGLTAPLSLAVQAATTLNVFTPATITSPVGGSTFTSTSVTFGWTAPTGATGYLLHLGTTGVGSSNQYSSGQITGTSATAVNLPANGETIYARLVTYFGTSSVSVDYTYTAMTATAAALTTPTPGSTFTSTSITFGWTAMNGATRYVLDLGSTGVGSSNLYASGTTGTTATATNLPANGEPIYARLYTYFGTASVSADYIYTAVTQSSLTTPAPGNTLISTTVTFDWTAPAGATGYLLHLGSTGAGSSNLDSSGQITGNTVTFNALPANGETIYARLFTYYGTASVSADYSYTAITATAATLSTPAPSSTFTSNTVTFGWSAVTGATKYLLQLGTTGVGSSNVYTSGGTTGTTATATGLPGIGETVYARLFTYFGTTAVSADFTYTDVTQSTLTTPTPSSTFTSTNVTFDWTAATGATKYLLHLGTTGVGSSNVYSSGGVTGTTATAVNLPGNGETIYVRLYTYYGTAYATTDYTYTDVTQSSLTTPTPSSTFTSTSVTFDWKTATGATKYLLHLGSTGVGSSNLDSSGQIAGTTFTFSSLPSNGETIYARLFTYWGTAYAYSDYTYTALTATAATLNSPTPGSTLVSPSTTFGWTAVTGATKYLLELGTTGVGSSNLYNSGGTTGTTATANNLPGNGETIYARLYTYFGTTSVSADSTYTDVTQSVLTTPTPGTAFTSTSVTFDWTAATGATKYLVHVGSTGVGSSNLDSSGQISGTTVTFAGLPNNSETIYVRLYTYFGTASAYTDYTYTAE